MFHMYDKNFYKCDVPCSLPPPPVKNCHSFSDPSPLERDVPYGRPESDPRRQEQLFTRLIFATRTSWCQCISWSPRRTWLLLALRSFRRFTFDICYILGTHPRLYPLGGGLSFQ